MQVIDFIIGLRLNLAIIMNGSNSIDLDKVKKTVKNMKNTNLINKNIVLAVIILVMIEIKKLKA